MTKALLVSMVFILTITITISCSKSNNGGGTTTVDCSTVTNKAFAADVSSIIQNSCAQSGCHNSGSGNGPGALTNYTQIAGAASTIRSSVSSGRMPKSGSLTTTQKNSIICWIDNGAPNN